MKSLKQFYTFSTTNTALIQFTDFGLHCRYLTLAQKHSDTLSLSAAELLYRTYFVNICKNFVFKISHQIFGGLNKKLNSTYCLTIVSVNKFISKLKLNFVN